MSEEQLKAFLEKMSQNSELMERVKAATTADEIVDIAKNAGFSISAGVLAKSELSSEELEGLAGGRAAACQSGGSPKPVTYCDPGF
jgi:predicted ribosomally synthesized peptide with nif11-like leader